MKQTSILHVMVAMLTLVCACYAGVDLVRDGKPLADIVMETNAISSVKLAASDLQEYIEKISGAKLAITNVPSEQFKCHVYVGPSEYVKKLGVTVDDLKPGGFKIIAKDNYLVLIGRDEQRLPFEGPRSYNEKLGINIKDATATLYATSELLEQLGIRWYAPYENGTIIPEKKTIEIQEQSLKKEARFPHRDFTYYNWMRKDADGILWFKRLKYGTSYIYVCGHNTRDIISPPEQKELHPEYYAMVNGKIFKGSKGYVPRLCDPGFRQASVNYLNKNFEACPSLVAMSLGMPDGFTQIDERDAKIWDRPGRGYRGKFSDYVWDYWLYAAKELKKTHPDKYLACISYTTFEEPPSQVDILPENVTLQMAYSVATLFLPQGQAQVKTRSRWLAMLTSKKLYTFDHYLYYRENSPRYPVFFTKLLQEDMQALAGVCEGKFIEIAPVTKGPDAGKLSCPGLTHMLHYWQGKLYWDPDMDRQKMLNEYYELYFGPARKEMKEFYEFAEEVWMRPKSRSISSAGLGFLQEQDVGRYFEILKRARENAGKDSVYDKRVAQIESEMEPLKSMFADLKRTGPDFSGSVIDIPCKIDGDLEKPFWKGKVTWYPMRDLATGDAVPDEKSTLVAFRMPPDKSALVIGVKCFEPAMDKIIVQGKDNDDFDIFNGDVIEIYIETPERSYFKIVMNPEGKIWDESQDVTIVERDTTPDLWNPGTSAAVKKDKNLWTAEIMIPTKDFGSKGPDKTNPWGINVCRARYSESGIPCYAISPTGKKLFRVLSKLGNLYVE